MKSLLSKPVYVIVSTNKFEMYEMDSIEPTIEISEIPFTTQRLLVGEYNIAEKTLKKLLKRANCFNPFVLIHQIEKFDGGLSEAEKSILTQISFGSGAADVVVHYGSGKLSQEEFLKKLKDGRHENKIEIQERIKNRGKINNWFAVIIIVAWVIFIIYAAINPQFI